MKYINNFGFGQKTGIDLNGESDGILFKPSAMGNVEPYCLINDTFYLLLL